MGWDRPRNLTDLLQGGWHLEVECPACGRRATFLAREIVDYFRGKGWNMDMEVAGGRFRCGGWVQRKEGCGHRGARLHMVSIYQRPVVPKPAPLRQDLAKERRGRRG